LSWLSQDASIWRDDQRIHLRRLLTRSGFGSIRTIIARSPKGDDAIHYFAPTWISSRSLSSGRPLRAGPA